MPPSDSLTENIVSLRLLSLDGGGIRGLSTLIILKYLMKRIDPDNPPKPCDYFHLIGGTSTGGLIALMLGRMRMDVDTCIEKYLTLAPEMFTQKRRIWDKLGKVNDLWTVRGRYNAERLETGFKRVANESGMDRESLLLDSSGTCKVFVCAYTKSTNSHVRLRSYDTDVAVSALSTSACKIWEAARATSAAATFFDPIKIGYQEYVDGATGYNNPVHAVLEEARAIWRDAPSRIQCLLSIGTGVPSLDGFGNNMREVVETLKAISTETEKTEQQFFRDCASHGVGGRYFRFNVNKGLEKVALDEHDTESISRIISASEAYLVEGKVQEMVEEFRNARSPQNILVDATERDKYLRWLPYKDSSRLHNSAMYWRKTKTTGDWFLKHTFDSWKAQRGSFIWLSAKAGSGKTVLASSIIQEIQSQNLGTLAYVYFSFNENEDDLYLLQCTILTQIVRSLSRNLSDREDRFFIPRAFRQLYKEYPLDSHPTTEHLKVVFNAILDESGSTYIVIDALDECSKSQTRKDLVDFLADLASTPTHNLHVIVTSREEEDIKTAMIGAKGNAKSFISFPVDKVNEDIKNHLLDRLNTAPYNNWKEEIKDGVVNHLTKNADGVFRWADLQLMELEGKHRRKDIFQLLERLPKGLDDTYTRMLSRIDDCHKMEVLSILRWLVYSKRPLLLGEINEIAACAPMTGDDSAEVTFFLDNRFPNLSEIRTMLRGLITVSSPDGVKSDDPPGQSLPKTESKLCMSLAHSSIRDYLLKGYGVSDTFRLTPTSSHWFIVKSCLAYIRYYDIECDGEDGRAAGVPYALLRYACKFVWAHFEALINELNGPAKELRIQELKQIEERHDGEAFQFSKRMKDNIAQDPNDSHSTIAHQAHQGSPAQLDAESPDALHVASRLGEIEVVRLLLDAGMDIDGRDSSKRTALHFAASNGQLETVKELINQGCAVDPCSDSGRSPLSEAAAEGHAEIVSVLLRHGSDATKSTVSLTGKIPDQLLYSSRNMDRMYTYVKTIAYRACHEASRVGRISDGLTPLHYATRYGRKEVVDTLLQNGVDIEQTSFWGQKPLSIAAAEGQVEVARMLIERGANISATLEGAEPNHPYSLLHVAAANWQPGIVEILVKAGVDIHKPGGPDLSSALHLAATGIANLAAATGWSDGPSMQNADTSQGADTARALLEGGAQIEQRDGNGETVLHVSAVNGYAEVVEVLLEQAKDADINALSNEGWAPLHHSACRGFTEIVRGLLIKGAEHDIRSEEQKWTPLLMASGCGHFDTVRVLVEFGASLDASDLQGHTALHAAASNGHEEVYRFLVEKGGDPHAEDHEGATAENMIAGAVETEN